MLKVFTNKSRGFTLIELLVVIAVIGLLASIVLVSVGPARAKARNARRQSDIRQINLAMEMCYDDALCGPGEAKYPVHAGTIPITNAWTKIDNDGTPTFLTMPSDPTNSGNYIYKWGATNEQYYCFYTQLEAPTAVTWYCASNKGVAQKVYAGPPTAANCCGMLNINL